MPPFRSHTHPLGPYPSSRSSTAATVYQPTRGATKRRANSELKILRQVILVKVSRIPQGGKLTLPLGIAAKGSQYE